MSRWPRNKLRCWDDLAFLSLGARSADTVLGQHVLVPGRRSECRCRFCRRRERPLVVSAPLSHAHSCPFGRRVDAGAVLAHERLTSAGVQPSLLRSSWWISYSVVSRYGSPQRCQLVWTLLRAGPCGPASMGGVAGGKVGKCRECGSDRGHGVRPGIGEKHYRTSRAAETRDVLATAMRQDLLWCSSTVELNAGAVALQQRLPVTTAATACFATLRPGGSLIPPSAV